MDDLLNVVLARVYLVGAVAVAALAYVNFRFLFCAGSLAFANSRTS